MSYDFTYDWTEDFELNIMQLYSLSPGDWNLPVQPINYLEIGVYEGKSACWMLDNILTHPLSRLTGVDIVVREKGWKNLESHKDKISIYEGDSKVIVPTLHQKYDLIYIDGDHTARGVLFDTAMCWRLAKRYILWDDCHRTGPDCDVKKGIDAFLSCIPSKEYKVVLNNTQFAIEKRTIC